MIISNYYSALTSRAILAPEPMGDLVEWTFSEDGSDFSVLTGLSPQINLFIPVLEGDKTYNHHPYKEFHPSEFMVAMHSTHDYDEEGIGMWVRWHYSDDSGDTWTNAGDLFPSHDVVDRRSGNSGRVVIPVDFVVFGGELFAVADVNDRD